MAVAPGSYDNIQRVPLAVKLSPRNATLSQDAWMKNVFLEQGDEGAYTVKRAGLSLSFSMVPGAYTTYQFGGMGDHGGGLGVWAIYGKQLASYNNASGGSPAPIATLAAPGQTAKDRYRFVTNSLPNNPYLVFQGSNTSVYSYGRGVSGLEYWVTQAGAAVTVPLLPSLCLLDNTLYVMDQAGRIWASGLGDITSWPALNMVQIDAALGTPAALWRHLNYLVAFGTTGMMFYYDAAISPGAPIAGVPNAVFRVGMPMAGALTLAEASDVTFFLGESEAQGLGVYKLEGLGNGMISTPAVNRLISAYLLPRQQAALFGTQSGERLGWPIGMTFKSAGHQYYVLTFPTFTYAGTTYAGITLTFSLTSGEWFIWTQVVAGVEKEWQVGAVCGNNIGQYFADASQGLVYALDESTYQDNGQPINVLIQTDLFNWGNQRVKIIPATYPLLDTQASTVYLSWTDDDYNTFSIPQPIATATAKKQLIRCGSTIQRAWQLTHTDNTPMRFYSLEVEVVPGAL